jgi:hypothetical protein
LIEQRAQNKTVSAQVVGQQKLDLHGAEFSSAMSRDFRRRVVLRSKITSGEGGDTLHPEDRARKLSPVEHF